MSRFTYHNPVKVISSNNWLASCEEQLQLLDIQNPLVVTFPEGIEWLALDKRFSPEQIFHDIVSNPTFTLGQEIVSLSKRRCFDGVLAIGGGSVMDTAKCAMAALGTEEELLEQLLTFSDPFPHRVPAIFVPTTHGTGSEVTMWATLWNLGTMTKHSISHQDLYPDVAVLDPGLTLTLPLDISLGTTLDALSHGFEAIWNKNANDTSTDYAIEAIVSILEQAPLLKVQPGNRDIRGKLLHAASTAGLAFSNTLTAAAHSISYPLTLHFGIPHGIAASISLSPLLDINGSAIEPTLERIYEVAMLNGLEELKDKINRIPEGYLAYRLQEWGVREEQLEWLVDQSFTPGRMDNNIVELNREDIRGIMETIY
ncbi:MAG: phosphonoacetaldehyde reductase [Fidelibacterota bacterium]|nr:MAG: phosphonoacetaldehyde reductase [Candidatus Neomarinimicrobiota bacterium]